MTGVESVLLYYKYVDLVGHQEWVHAWFLDLCSQLGMVGRVRVARDGINVTVGGDHQALLKHIDSVQQQQLFAGDIDFKLAVSSGALNEQATRESGFDSLQVSICKEVVSLRNILQCPPGILSQQTAMHLMPKEWHKVLEDASKQERQKPVVLLDARNIYETRIGHFSAEGAELLDPKLRHFSDLPDWLEKNAQILADRRVMMYCTGGVRCERASALLRNMGPAFQDVCQLQGGIQRYLEQFPDGGFFRGKNFVFDERVAVAPEAASQELPVGSCLECGATTDDYSPRLRCRICRLLVLVCPKCSQKSSEFGLQCELCQERAALSLRPMHHSLHLRKLRILCLHGFRQTGSSLRGKLANFIKALSEVAEFTFADAPHALPFLYKPAAESDAAKPLPEIDATRPRRAWLVEPSQLANGLESQVARWEIATEGIDAEQYTRQTRGWQQSRQHLEQLITHHGPFDGCFGISQGAAIAAALCAEQGLERIRCTQQCADKAPASSKAARAANCHENSKPPHAEASRAASCIPDGSDPAAPHCGMVASDTAGRHFRFAILCSGYLSRAPEHRKVQQQIQRIELPSLHVYGTQRSDRHICFEESKSLEAAFSEKQRVAIVPVRGHVMPVDRPTLSVYKRFLALFL